MPDPKFHELLHGTAPRHAHLIGICGSGMRSLADYLVSAGWTVSGSDSSLRARDEREFSARNIQVFHDHVAKHISPATDVVVYSLAIPDHNPELQAARQNQLLTFSYVEMIGQLFSVHQGVGIAGTHGKTTTTCLLDHILRAGGSIPGILCGGRMPGEVDFGRQGESGWLVAECCEFRQSFLKMQPRLAAVLGVEPDHFDCYPDEASLRKAFAGFCYNVHPSGLLIVNAGYRLAVEASRQARCAVEYYVGDSAKVHYAPAQSVCWKAVDIEPTAAGTAFTVCRGEERGQRYQIPLYGVHQVGNALAAVRLALAAGVDEELVRAGLSTFRGVERRFQVRYSNSHVTVIDDYAHHPTEIRATIAAARQKSPDARLVVAFQPHQILRTEVLMSEFAEALAVADKVYILPIFAAREQADQRTEQVARRLVEEGNRLRWVFEYCSSLDHLRLMLDDMQTTHEFESKTTFLTLGAGDIDRIFYELPG